MALFLKIRKIIDSENKETVLLFVFCFVEEYTTTDRVFKTK